MSVEKRYNEVMVSLEKTFNEFPWENKKAYSNWVAQTYHFVLHSTRIFARGSSRCSPSQEKLHLKYLEHLKEEQGHEHLALKDLKRLGVSINDYPEFQIGKEKWEKVIFPVVPNVLSY